MAQIFRLENVGKNGRYRMFEIAKPKPLTQLNAIVIDQNSLVRDSIKNTLFSLGLPYIRSADGAYQALAEFRHKQFDVVILSFDLNTDKDGFHLLEELKFKGHIKKSTCVIFVSADTDPALVHCVVELQPDDFWTKPLDFNKVRERILHILDCRRLLYKPFYCADHKAYSRAIYYAERCLERAQFKAFYSKLQRLIGDCLCQMGEFSEAEKFYSDLLSQVDYGWVHIGHTYALLKQGKFVQAQSNIEDLKQRPDTRFTVHDLLANYCVEQGDFQKAYAEIQQATKLAPRNIERNKRACDLAKLNHDAQGQYICAFHMEKYARNSIHESPEITLHLIRANIDLAASTASDAGSRSLQRASKQLRELREKADPSFEQQIQVIEARILVTQGEKKLAENKAKSLRLSRLAPSLDDNMDLVKLYHALGYREKAIALLNEIKSQLVNEAFSNPIILRYLEQEMVEKKRIHFTPRELIDMASAYYKQKRFVPAFKALSEALQLAPSNVHIALSLLKILVAIDEVKSLDGKHIEVMQRCFSAIEKGKLTEEQHEKARGYMKLLSSFVSVQQITAEVMG